MKSAVIQLNSNDQWQENLEQAEYWIVRAVEEESAKLIVLPENFLCFGGAGLPSLSRHLDEVTRRLSELARTHQLFLVAGSIPHLVTDEPKGRYFSRSILFGPEGDVSAEYDKIHLFDVDVADAHGRYRESENYSPGQQVVVTELDAFNLGMSICYDLRFGAMYQAMRLAGADIFSVPAAFTFVTGEAHWATLLKARAIENQCFVLAANQVGAHSKGRETWGHSMIIDPWGRVLSQCSEEVGYCAAELDMSLLREIRSQLPVFNHQRSDLY